MNALGSNSIASPKQQTAVACSHCGAAVPAGMIERETTEQFCCRGCRTAYALIHEYGLEAFYDRNQPTGLAVDDSPLARSFGDFDQPAFEELYVQAQGDGQKSAVLVLNGIHCAACIWLLEKLPRLVDGVIAARVNWNRSTVEVSWNSEATCLSEIALTLNRLGYAPAPVRSGSQQAAAMEENRRQLINLGVAAALAGNNMLIGAALYFGLLSELGNGIETMFRGASCLLGLLSLLGPGRGFLRTAWSAIRSRTAHVDIPVAVALLMGTVSGLWNTLRGSGEIYFDSISSLVALLLVGRYIQFRQQRQTAEAVDLLYRLTPRTARKKFGSEFVETLAELIEPGDLLEVLPGQGIPADGTLISGQSNLDEALLTGESRPVAKVQGEAVYAGTYNLTSPIELVVTRSGRATRVGQLMELMESASRDKPPIIEWANRAGVWFVYGVLVVALSTLLYWTATAPSRAVENTVAVLIVACPCVIALAAPLTLSLAISRAASRGILIKSGEVLQRLAKPGVLWLDKTGTLTRGQTVIAEWFGEREWIRYLVALEYRSTHPLAVAFSPQAIEASLGVRVVDLPAVQSFVQDSRGGIRGRVAGRELTIGNSSLLAEMGVAVPAAFERIAVELAERGLTAIFYAVDGAVCGVIGIGDPLRAESLATVNSLQAAGWTVGILSGDRPETVAAIGKQLEIPAEFATGGLTPEQKTARVRESREGQTVVMVGDGVNDSAALAAASVGIAVKGGAEASLVAAPVFLSRVGLDGLLELTRASRQTLRTIHFSLLISILYNTFSVGLATMGLIHPLIAALMMPISSLTTIGLAYSSRAFQGRGRRP
jgi:Cu2+-exporting ATPase